MERRIGEHVEHSLASPSDVAARSTAVLASSTCACVGSSVATIGTADHIYEYSLSGVLPPCSRGETSTVPSAIHSGISSAGRCPVSTMRSP
ncbi:MAG: hypothetical protein ABIQ10_14780 [Gemmatimonadaceae bacterium]